MHTRAAHPILSCRALFFIANLISHAVFVAELIREPGRVPQACLPAMSAPLGQKGIGMHVQA